MIPANKFLHYQYRKFRYRMSMARVSSTEPCCVQVDIWPPELTVKNGNRNVPIPYSAPPIYMKDGESFQSSLAQLREENPDFCDADVWDDMGKACAHADTLEWDTFTTEPWVMSQGDVPN